MEGEVARRSCLGLSPAIEIVSSTEIADNSARKSRNDPGRVASMIWNLRVSGGRGTVSLRCPRRLSEMLLIG